MLLYLWLMKAGLFKELRDGLSHLFYPRLCEGCSKPLVRDEEVLCLACSMELPETGFHLADDNEAALRFAGRIPYSHATSLAYFTNDGLLQHLLHGLKYRGRKEVGIYLGRRLGMSLMQSQWVSAVDLIVPVPLHKAKKAKRGYNQSSLIARGISEKANIAYSDNVLARVKDTDSQTRKTRAERADNMQGAFKVIGQNLDGKHILLCDDVLTTGATLEACAQALLTVNNVKISIATIGIAMS